MSREKSIQIPETLFLEICKYFLLDMPDGEEIIKKGLENKLESITKHDLYSKYKTAPTPEEQEKARREYLEKAGIPESFRW